MPKPENEWPLGSKDRVWIGERLVEPGIYDRYAVTPGPKGINLSVALRLFPGSRQETYDLSTVPVYVEFHPTSPSQTNTPVKDLIQDLLQLNRYTIPKDLLQYPYTDRRFPEFYRQSDCRPIATIDQLLQDDPKSIIFTANDLRGAGYAGLYVENCGFKDIYPTEELLYITKNPQERTITICHLTANSTIAYSTYRLPKITRAGLLAFMG